MESLAELRALIARYVASAPMTALAEKLGIQLSSYTQTTEPTLNLSQPIFAIVAQGTKQGVIGNRVYEYKAGQYLVVTVDLPLLGHVSQASIKEPFLAAGVVLRPAIIAALLLETATTNHSDAAEMPAIAVSDDSADFIEPVVRLLRLLERPADVPILLPMIEREIHWRLLTGQQGALVRQIGLADSHLSRISQAIRWIRTHYTEPIRIEELAGLSAMSLSSFHRHFRAATAMSPLQYQKQIRLQEARARLLTEEGSITSVGFGVGYDSPSQFSREYRRLFGASPIQDAGRLRGTAKASNGS